MAVIGQAAFTEADIASAATCNIGATDQWRLRITGTTTITSFGVVANKIRFLRFAGILLLTYNATTLILPGLANITTAAGDTCIAVSDASGNWTVVQYQRAAAQPHETGTFTPTLTLSTPGDISVVYASRYGEWTRIGNRVFLDLSIEATPTYTTGAGSWRIGTLPFTPAQNSAGSLRLFQQIGLSAGFTWATLAASVATAYCNILSHGSAQNVEFATNVHIPSGTAMFLQGSLVYRV